MDKQELIDQLVEEVYDFVNMLYAGYKIDEDEALDRVWTEATVTALRIVQGNIQAEETDRPVSKYEVPVRRQRYSE